MALKSSARGTDWYTGTKKLAEAVVPPVVTVPNPPLPENPEPEPPPLPPTPTTGFPDATNTGVKAGVALTKFTGVKRSTKAGEVIQNLDITGSFYIVHADVTIRNCKLTATTRYHAIHQDRVKNLTVEDCEINGQGCTNGILAQGKFRRNNIYGVNNGINTWGGLSEPGVIEGNFIHDFKGECRGSALRRHRD